MKKNLLNIKFNRLTVFSENGRNRHGQVLWNCLCDCGNTTKAISAELINGHVKSCGCLYIENVKYGSITHGMCVNKKSAEYRAWDSMKQRCYNKKVERYHYYGGERVEVCERWLNSFENFFEDMGERPSSLHSLDRFPNKNGNYEPSNCRWATTKQQNSNKRNNKWIEYGGLKMIHADWERYLGLKPKMVYHYLSKGIPFELIVAKRKQLL